jgi:hypothetical protein
MTTQRFIPNPDGIVSEYVRNEGILVPESIYHAAHSSRLMEIVDGGIPHSWDGMVYTADTPEHAANFLAFRFPVHEIIAFQIVTKGIELARFDLGRDHAPGFFPGEVFTVEGDVEPEHLGLDMYSFGEEVDA